MPSGLMMGASTLFVAGAFLSFGEAARTRAVRMVASVRGEDIVSDLLDEAGAMDRIDGIVARDPKGRTAQIDHVVRGEAGLVVVETKNWSGTVQGGSHDVEWIQLRRNGQRQIHRNPISQAKRQSRILALETGLPVVPLVVMAGRATHQSGSFPEGVVDAMSMERVLRPMMRGEGQAKRASPTQVLQAWERLATRAGAEDPGEVDRYSKANALRYGQREWTGWAAMAIAAAAAATAVGADPTPWHWPW